jgi:hypothetical protein
MYGDEMKKIKIAFDCDGVLLNFMQTTSKFIESHYGFKHNVDYSACQYDLYERFKKEDIDSVNFDKIKEEFERYGHWSKLEPMPHIENAKALFADSRYDISFVTSLHVHLFEERIHNLSIVLGQEIDPNKLFCVPLGRSKKPYIDMLTPDFFIEDNLNNLVECQGNHTSIWIDLKESYYDKTKLEGTNIHTVENLNEGIEYLQNCTFNNRKKVKP